MGWRYLRPMAKRVLTIVAWSLCLLGVGFAGLSLVFTIEHGQSAVQEIDGIVFACLILIGSYVTARAFTSIIAA